VVGRYVGESVEQPLLYYKNNFAATVTLLTLILNFQSLPVVFSSSCASYGIPKCIPISENHRNSYQTVRTLEIVRLLTEVMLEMQQPQANDQVQEDTNEVNHSYPGEAHEPKMAGMKTL
jgi:UDP-glucose 4-epimerase